MLPWYDVMILGCFPNCYPWFLFFFLPFFLLLSSSFFLFCFTFFFLRHGLSLNLELTIFTRLSSQGIFHTLLNVSSSSGVTDKRHCAKLIHGYWWPHACAAKLLSSKLSSIYCSLLIISWYISLELYFVLFQLLIF